MNSVMVTLFLSLLFLIIKQYHNTISRDAAHNEMIELFSKVINARRASGQAPEGSIDMLQKLIDAEYKEGGKLPASEIAGLLIAALFAGQHTSSITSSWTLMFLLEDRKKGMHTKEIYF